MMGLLDYLLSRFRWYRRLRGGHWELRYIHPPVSSEMWFRQPHGVRFFGEQLLACEDHG